MSRESWEVDTRDCVGSGDRFVNGNFGGMGNSEEEKEVPKVKLEKTEEDLDFCTPPIIMDPGKEVDGVGAVRFVTEKLEEGMSADASCSCGCWRELQALKEVVREQGDKLQDLTNIVIKLLGKQESKSAGKKDDEKKVEMVPPPEQQSRAQMSPAPELQDTGINGVKKITSTGSGAPVDGGTSRLPTASGSNFKPTNLFKDVIKDRSEKSPNFNPARSTASPKSIRSPSKNASFRPPAARSSPRRPFKKHHHHHDSKKQYRCTRDLCGKLFSSQDSLNKHVQIRHDGIRYQCAHCDAFFCSNARLRDHEKIHAVGKPLLKCDLCGTEAISEASLQAHLVSRHRLFDSGIQHKIDLGKRGQEKKKRPGILPCPRCPRSFNCGASLLYHLKNEHKSVT